MEMCRACLSTGKEMVLMDGVLFYNFNILTNLNITITKETPRYSCSTCVDAINFCTEFREKCITSDRTLKEVIKQSINMDIKPDVVKIEVKNELEYGSDAVIWEDYYSDNNDLVNSPNMIEAKQGEDCTPIKTSKRLKIKVNREPKKKKATKVKLKKVANDDTLQNCGICPKKLDSMESLLKHFEQHKLDKCCGMCTERFIDSTHVMAHRIEHIPKEQRKCLICSARFISPNYLEFHYIKKHNLRGDGGLLLCKQCLGSYENPKKLGKHIWSVHADIKFHCDDCGKGLITKSQLRKHMLLHTKKKNYLCDLCDYTAKYPGNVREHKIRRHTEGRIYCKPCGRAFASKEVLDQHRCKQLPETICPICGIYVRQTHLPRHMKTHTNKFLYKCERCPSQFKTAACFRAHQNKHDGNRTFQCPHCSMSFYSQSVLIKHKRTHTGEKPYVCKICSKGFTGNNNLKVHMKVHGQDLVKKKSSLDLHIFG